MVERDRALRLLDEAEPSIERLATYESPAALQDALRATWHAVETSLRQLLRGDTAVSDDVRLRALSRTDMPFDAVITELRRSDAISLSLAGRLHEFGRAVERADVGPVRAADADLAQEAVAALRSELRSGPAPSRSAARTPDPVDETFDAPSGIGSRLRRERNAQRSDAAASDEGVADDVAYDRSGLAATARRPVVLVAVAVLLLAGIIAAVLLFGRTDPMDEGIEAFRAGRGGVAEQHFRAALQRDEDNVTARLYLARVLRGQQRHEEAADLLREAARRAPRDAAVRRELGYLFLDLERPAQAATQFQQAVELDPEEPRGWLGLVHSLRLAGDPSSEVWLARAPSAAQAMIRSGRSP
jgi:tetratricopeptide (TPR) repeat protein